MDERRSHPRIEVMLTGNCNGTTCQLKDISTSGVQLLAAQPFPVDRPTELTLRITLQVKWCEKVEEEMYAVGGEKGAAMWVPRTDGDDQGESSREPTEDLGLTEQG